MTQTHEQRRAQDRQHKQALRDGLAAAVLAASPPAEWRPIDGAPDYFVSDDGRVRRRFYILRGFLDDQGYPSVDIGGETKRIHRLVAAAFLGPRLPGLEVRHLNDIKTDNRLANLAYGTRDQNQQDAVANGNHFQAHKTHCVHGHEFTESNTVYKVLKSGVFRQRVCVTCQRQYREAYNQRRRASAGE